MARSEGGRPCGCRRTWHGWSAEEGRAHSLCERGGGGGRGERVGERGRGRERMKAMGRDYMDMPLHGHALTIHLAMVGWVTSPFFSF